MIEDVIEFEMVANGKRWHHGKEITVFTVALALKMSTKFWTGRRRFREVKYQTSRAGRKRYDCTSASYFLGYGPPGNENDEDNELAGASIVWLARVHAWDATVKISSTKKAQEWASAEAVCRHVWETIDTCNNAVHTKRVGPWGVLGSKRGHMQTTWERFESASSSVKWINVPCSAGRGIVI